MHLLRRLRIITALALIGTAAVTLAAEPVAVGSAGRGDLRVMLVGQALVKKDLRTVVPTSVAQARDYLSGADVVFTNLETSIAPRKISCG